MILYVAGCRNNIVHVCQTAQEITLGSSGMAFIQA